MNSYIYFDNCTSPLGEALYREKVDTEEDFFWALEAFLVNISMSSLSTEQLGAFEAFLHNNRKVIKEL